MARYQRPTSRRPTMVDVAHRAGVSLKTVSRVVNGEDGVSGELVARVADAVAALGYRPDDRARRLRRAESRTGTIGFVLVDVANPFFSSTLRGIEDVARSRHCLVLAGSTDGSEMRERQLVEAFIDRRLDGLIVVPSGRGLGALAAEIELGTPVVILDLEMDTDVALDLVRSDHYGGAAAATRHLLANGHRDIAYMGDDRSIFSARLRLDAFRDVMRSEGLDLSDGRIVLGSHSVDEWCELALAVFGAPSRPTAVFTGQNFVTMGAVRALHELGLQHRVAMVGFDEIDMAESLDPGITVIPQDPRDLGRRAAELLFDRIAGDDRPPTRDIVVHPLIERGSGEIRPEAS